MLEAALLPRKLSSLFWLFYFFDFGIPYYVDPDPEPECSTVPVPLR